LLSSTLRQALDPDIFAVASSKASFDAPENTFVYFDQVGTARRSHRNDLVSPASNRVIAVVDRTANLEEAAKALVMARFGFGGKSPYAPDLILVNEFCKQEFLKIATRHAFQFMTDREQSSGQRDIQDFVSVLQKANDGTRIITSGSGGIVVDITKGYVSFACTERAGLHTDEQHQHHASTKSKDSRAVLSSARCIELR